MKQKKFFILMLLIVSVIFFCSGCNYTNIIYNNENLMVAPQGNSTQENIKTVLSSNVGSYELKYPKIGQYRSAVILKDIDGDNAEEAIVFYKQKDSYIPGITVTVLKKTENNWEIVGQFTNSLSEVRKIEFGNIDDDNILELIIEFSTENQSSSNITILKYHDALTPVIQNMVFSHFEVQDFDQDGKSEIILLSSNSNDKTVYAKLIKYNTISFTMDTIGRVSLNKHISEWVNVQVGNIFKDQKGLIIDELLNNGKYATDIIYWDNQKSALKAPFYNQYKKSYKHKKSSIYRQTIRKTMVFSSDKNNDNIFDIPIEHFALKKNSNSSKECPFIYWSTFDIVKNRFATINTTIVNTNDGYYITIPKEWLNKTAVQINSVDKILTISYLEKDKNNSFGYGNAILKLQSIPLISWELSNENFSDFKEIMRTDSTVYAVSILSNNGVCRITEKKLKNLFTLI